ncbi:CRISPR-associated helicase/endonuclease Cas3 [Paenibacillus sp. YN15]|nr:CRISPR-associated helicase/endonuclease Cas3 [Paenibacillus sp. YN15]
MLSSALQDYYGSRNYDINIQDPDVYIAHISDKEKRVQTVPEHLEAVKEGCETFGKKAGVSYLAGMAGLLHDMGKNTPSFKRYIQLATADPDHPPRRGSVDHSTAGGRWVYQRYCHDAASPVSRIAAEWIANCVISHHQGLRDYLGPEASSPFLDRVLEKKDGMEEYEQAVAAFVSRYDLEKLDQYFALAVAELEEIIRKVKANRLKPIIYSLLNKYLFSCLLDADRSDTRQFEEGKKEPWEKDNRWFFAQSYERVLQRLNEMNGGEAADKPINRLRSQMSQQCEEFAVHPSGIYTLSIPTGGGKTLASLRYALKHALAHGRERIIYIVPYTTIIEQNAKEVRDILQDEEHILEHHSNILDDQDTDTNKSDYLVRKERLSLIRDNWDSPIIFTTMVQFLNTIYAKGTRNTRRLHRLCNAVIIFDEVQAVPPKCISLFNAALNFLHVLGNSSILLCTATQPALHFVKNRLQMPEQAEIIQNREEVSDQFKRVELINRVTSAGWDTEELTQFIQERMMEVRSTLVVLNTKSAVRKLYTHLTKESGADEEELLIVHLSTNMCPAHRREVLEKVNKALDPKNPKRIICISTQLIEAGVNVSFQCVIRSLAGLDSIAQAAGRCNRHGEVLSREVYMIRSAEEKLSKLPHIKIGAETTERVMRDYESNPGKYGGSLLSPKVIEEYFRLYYDRIKEELDYPIPRLEKNMFDLLNKNQAYYESYCRTYGNPPELYSYAAFATAEQHFEVISQATVAVLVPFNEEANNILLDLNGAAAPERLGELLRKAQQYVVNVYDPERKALEREGHIFSLLHGQIFALQKQAYSLEFGLDPDGEGGSSMGFEDV